MVFVLSESPVILRFCGFGRFTLYHFLAVSRAVFGRNKDFNLACFQSLKKSKSLKDSKSLKIGCKFNDFNFGYKNSPPKASRIPFGNLATLTSFEPINSVISRLSVQKEGCQTLPRLATLDGNLAALCGYLRTVSEAEKHCAVPTDDHSVDDRHP